jgi:hypothetical protein
VEEVATAECIETICQEKKAYLTCCGEDPIVLAYNHLLHQPQLVSLNTGHQALHSLHPNASTAWLFLLVPRTAYITCIY